MNDVFDKFRSTHHVGRLEQRGDAKTHPTDWQAVAGDEIPELKHELENHFRELLGVDLDRPDVDDR